MNEKSDAPMKKMFEILIMVLRAQIFEELNFEDDSLLEYIEIKFPSKISTYTVFSVVFTYC